MRSSYLRMAISLLIPSLSYYLPVHQHGVCLGGTVTKTGPDGYFGGNTLRPAPLSLIVVSRQ